MPLRTHIRLVNPRLGTYYAIFAGAFTALVLSLLIFEQLGFSKRMLRLAMLAGPIALFMLIGLAVTTRNTQEFFASGRRVPSFFNGLVLGVTALGGVGFVVLTGLFFVNGFDALCLVIGWCAGLVMMVVLIAPYIRKSGAYTVPSYLARRFESNLLRVIAAALLSVPLLLLIAAEVRVGALAASWLLGRSEQTAAVLILVAIAIPLAGGGMRALTWTSAAKSIVAVLALLVPVTVLATMATNLPLPQMSHGPVLRALGRQEVWQAFPQAVAAPFGFDLAGPGKALITQRFATPFASVGRFAFILASLVFMAGIASSPSLLLRAGTTLGVYETRKSIGWAAVILGVMVMTMSSVAVFMRDLLMDQVVGATRDHLPIWFANLMQMGLAGLDGKAASVVAASITLKRDAVLMALPIAAGFPVVAVYLALAGALAAAMAGASSAIYALGATISEDVVLGLKRDAALESIRLTVARLAIVLAAGMGGWAAVMAQADPLKLLFWSLAVSGSTAFPALVFSIWWKPLNKWGAGAGMVAGFVVAVLAIVAGEAGQLPLNSELAGIFGIPAGLIAGLVANYITPMPKRHIFELIRDIRVPRGETVYDRDMRLLRLKQRARD